MIKVLLPLLAIPLTASVAFARGEEILQIMHREATEIIRVKILDPENSIEVNSNLSRDTLVALCVVEESIKGNLQKGDLLRFLYHRSPKARTQKAEYALVQTGADLVVFLRSTQKITRKEGSGEDAEAIYGETIDGWVGVVPYQSAMVELLKDMTENQQRARQDVPTIP